jgi:hypothetical protein
MLAARAQRLAHGLAPTRAWTRFPALPAAAASRRAGASARYISRSTARRSAHDDFLAHNRRYVAEHHEQVGVLSIAPAKKLAVGACARTDPIFPRAEVQLCSGVHGRAH